MGTGVLREEAGLWQAGVPDWVGGVFREGCLHCAPRNGRSRQLLCEDRGGRVGTGPQGFAQASEGACVLRGMIARE